MVRLFAAVSFAAMMAAGPLAVQAQAPAPLPAPGVPAQTIGDLLKTPAPKDNPVVAKFDGVELRRSDVIKALEGLPPQVQQLPVAQVYPLLLDRLVDSKLISSQARKDKLADDAEVKRRVADFEERVLGEVYLDRAVRAQIDDKAIQARYDEFLKTNPPQEEVRARHILVADEKKAVEIIDKLKKGGDFSALAKDNSQDGSARDGGDLGFFTKEMMVPEFSDAAFQMKKGEFTQTPVKSQFGWHVIKLEERRMAAPPSLDEMRADLTADMSQEKVTEVVAKLRGGVKVERFDLDGKPLPEAKP
jgi:peptidyl-prolyl cis-trans isomerase C